MIEIALRFSIEEGVRLLRSHGFEVSFRPMPFHFGRDHGEGYDSLVDVWVVTDPRNGRLVLLETYFRCFLQRKAGELFLQADKLELINLFELVD